MSNAAADVQLPILLCSAACGERTTSAVLPPASRDSRVRIAGCAPARTTATVTSTTGILAIGVEECAALLPTP